MFADVEADIYVLVDGDGTYEPAAAPAMVALLQSARLDMVTATRVTGAARAYRPGHRAGNTLLSGLVAALFGARVTDMLSGYRVFSRRFVKSFPALAAGFETETELTVHALQLAMPIGELPAPYRERPAGSASQTPHRWRRPADPPPHPHAGERRTATALLLACRLRAAPAWVVVRHSDRRRVLALPSCPRDCRRQSSRLPWSRCRSCRLLAG